MRIVSRVRLPSFRRSPSPAFPAARLGRNKLVPLSDPAGEALGASAS
jgi:hypothetical protein